jgi:F0F1-type ATP synthase assembly protein I
MLVPESPADSVIRALGLVAILGSQRMPESFDRTVARLMQIGAVGTEMVAPIVIGWVIDYYTGFMPLFMILGAIGGLVFGIRQLIQFNKTRPSA